MLNALAMSIDEPLLKQLADSMPARDVARLRWAIGQAEARVFVPALSEPNTAATMRFVGLHRETVATMRDEVLSVVSAWAQEAERMSAVMDEAFELQRARSIAKAGERWGQASADHINRALLSQKRLIHIVMESLPLLERADGADFEALERFRNDALWIEAVFGLVSVGLIKGIGKVATCRALCRRLDEWSFDHQQAVQLLFFGLQDRK